MPYYSYKCANCNHIWEKMLPISRRHEKQHCEHCNSTDNRMIITRTDFFFKTPKGANIIDRSPMKDANKE